MKGLKEVTAMTASATVWFGRKMRTFRRSRRSRSSHPFAWKLRLEPLEDRTVPSTWTPTTPFLQNSGLTVMSPGNQTAMPGSDTLLNLGSFSDTNSGANSWSVDVNWGDSTPDTTFTTSTQGSLGQAIHNFAQGGIYTATVRVTDNLNASNSANFQVNVSSG